MRAIITICILLVFSNIYSVRVDAQECLPTRLAIGDQARVTPGAANRIRAQSNTSSEQVGQIPAGEVLTILDGPQCVDGFLWWRINYNEIEGWTVEASAPDYFLEPYVTVTPANDTENCLTETRLQIGGYGQVSTTTPSRLRLASSTGAEQIGQVDPTDIFQVVDGPVCADGFNWWQVAVNGIMGWLAEGDSETFYVEPVTDPLITGTSTTELPLIAYSASWNVDGSRVAIATSNGVFIYDTTDWKILPSQLDEGIITTDIAFSPTDSNLLVMKGTENALFRFRAYDISNAEGELLFELPRMEGPLGGDLPAYDLAFSADGSRLGFGGSSYEIFDTDSWEQLNYLDISVEAGNHYAQIPFFFSDLSPSGDYGAGAIDDGVVHVFDFTIPHISERGEVDPRLSTLDRGGRTQDITAVKFSPDGTHLIVGDNTGSLQMWQLETGTRTSFIRADDQPSRSNYINDIAFHPNDELVATAESDPSGVVRIFNTEDLRLLTVFDGNKAHEVASTVSYSPDGEWLLVIMDNTIYVLDAVNGEIETDFMIAESD